MSRIPPFNEFLGTEILGLRDDEFQVRLELKPHHCNRRGVAHGGVVTSLLDTAMGGAVIASIPESWWCATTSLTTQFIGGATGTLIGSGRVLRRGSKVAFATGEVRDERDRVVASAQGTWHLWSERPGLPSSPPPGYVHLLETGRNVRVGKILAVGRNYAEHRVEMGAPVAGPPLLFFKPATALHHPGTPLTLPTDAGAIHHEVELVAAIGTAGRAIPADRALDHVSGFAVGIDLTLRDVQSEAKKNGTPWSLSKGFDGSAPISAVAPRSAVGDGSGLNIQLRVNGDVRQHGNTSQMQRSVAQLIEFASRWIRLEPGDLLFTGTPSGVGPIEPGDRARAEIERVGTLEIEVAR